MQHLIFLDIETTGLDPRDKHAEILELGLIAVDRQLNEVSHWSTPVSPSSGFMGSLPPELVEMHSNSGLLGELRGPRANLRFEAGGLPTLKQAEAVALQFMAAFAPDRSSPMCGANVGAFDRQWLKVHMPALEAAFHYRNLDTNTCFLLEQFLLGRSSKKGETRHRALDDARQSLSTLRRFLGCPT